MMVIDAAPRPVAPDASGGVDAVVTFFLALSTLMRPRARRRRSHHHRRRRATVGQLLKLERLEATISTLAFQRQSLVKFAAGLRATILQQLHLRLCSRSSDYQILR